MTATVEAGQALRLVGTPHRMVLIGEIPGESVDWRLVLSDELAAYGPGRLVPLRARQRKASPPRARLAPTTPPGAYAARLETEGHSHELTVEVAPAPRLRIVPASIRLSAPPGGTASAKAVLTNRGNTTFAVPSYLMVGLYDDDGIEFAFADTYRQNQDNAEKLFGHWLKKLREGYGGMLRLEVTEGAGSLGPGAARLLSFTGQLPQTLKSRHGYHGFWTLETSNILIEVSMQRHENGASS
ncbi:MAG: hypothetical protein JO227_04320 [Acetobacteraceae bacterium]|nr:hypothetical protein [Acetobacteraceae bacterium]